MKITGTFRDQSNDNQYRVTISDVLETGITYVIKDPTDDDFDPDDNTTLCFSADPVHISCSRNELDKLIVISQATIKLTVRRDMTDSILANMNREIYVKIERLGAYPATIFFGYVDPLQFNQDYAYEWNEVTINATDPLGALNDITIDKTSIGQGDVLTVKEFINRSIGALDQDESLLYTINVITPENINIGSIKVNASVFYGEDEDDRMTLYDSLQEILKYIGCTISYEPNDNSINVYSLYTDVTSYQTSVEWFDGKDDTMDASASISIDDAYSQVTLECDIEPNDDDIKLIDDDYLYSDYSNYQKYMTELICIGGGDSSYRGLRDLMYSPDGEESSNNSNAYRIENFCYVKRNDAWDFGPNSYIEYMNGAQGDNPAPMTGDQSNVLRWLKSHPMKGAFVSFGRGKKINLRDNSPVNNITMNDYLVISIQGHNDHSTDGHIETLSNNIDYNKPICKYTGLSSLNLVPTDSSITNYIVISGKMILNAIQPRTGFPVLSSFDQSVWAASLVTYSHLKQFYDEHTSGVWIMAFGLVIPYDESDWAYYMQKWWNMTNGQYVQTDADGVFGFLENKKNQKLKYTYSNYGDETDIISKLPILACKLKIGNKYCVERLDLGEEGQGKFEWWTIEQFNSSELHNMGAEEPYFTIGIDPKVGDDIVGIAHGIQNTIDYSMNIDGTGTAIPITINDGLNGVPEFTILGPINSMWNEIERIHPSFWRHTSWNDHLYWTLETLDSILVSDLKIEFKNNNGMTSTDKSQADNDLVYASDTNPIYIEKLEEDLKICTPLTIEECEENGIKYQNSNSYVMNVDNTPFRGWVIGGNYVKPEHLLVDYLFKQYQRPAKMVNINVDAGFIYGVTDLTDNSSISPSTIISKYIVDMTYPGIPKKNYYVYSIDWNLKTMENEITMRERLDYSSPF